MAAYYSCLEPPNASMSQYGKIWKLAVIGSTDTSLKSKLKSCHAHYCSSYIRVDFVDLQSFPRDAIAKYLHLATTTPADF